MQVRHPYRAIAAIAVAALIVGCGFTSNPKPESQPEPERPEATQAKTPARTTKAAPAATTAKAGKTGTLSSRTTAGTKERVSCSDIQTEVKLVAFGGSVAWTSRVVDNWTPTSVGSPVSTVSVAPPSGSLAADGASVVVKIRGSYPASKQRFYVLFEYPTSVGSGAVNLDVNC